MRFDLEKRHRIFNRTSGYCHICHQKLAFKNYGKFGTRGAWEIEHSKPISKGGTNHLSNLYPACISCNRKKLAKSTRTARRTYNKTRAPLSIVQRERVKRANAIEGIAIGGLLGKILFGKSGAVLGALIGGNMGYQRNPDKS